MWYVQHENVEKRMPNSRTQEYVLDSKVNQISFQFCSQGARILIRALIRHIHEKKIPITSQNEKNLKDGINKVLREIRKEILFTP